LIVGQIQKLLVGLGAEHKLGLGAEPLVRTQKLNTLAYMTITVACNFAHKRFEYAKKVVMIVSFGHITDK